MELNAGTIDKKPTHPVIINWFPELQIHQEGGFSVQVKGIRRQFKFIGLVPKMIFQKIFVERRELLHNFVDMMAGITVCY